MVEDLARPKRFELLTQIRDVAIRRGAWTAREAASFQERVSVIFDRYTVVRRAIRSNRVELRKVIATKGRRIILKTAVGVDLRVWLLGVCDSSPTSALF